DGILFQVPAIVEWSQAEQSCQKYNGTLFKPNATSFDVSLFSEWNFNDDVWVAATYIKVLNFESEPYNLVLSDGLHNWNEANQWCSEHFSEFGNNIQNASSLFPHGYFNDICFWTRNVILVSFQTTL
ncbi:hypothetical protein ACJMK2_022190, partial [Sinanodonta woodiana]